METEVIEVLVAAVSPLPFPQQGKDEAAVLQEEAGKDSLQSGGFCRGLCLVGIKGQQKVSNSTLFSHIPRATAGAADTAACPDRATPEQSDGPAGPPF